MEESAQLRHMDAGFPRQYHMGNQPNSQSLRTSISGPVKKTLEKFGNDGFYYDFAPWGRVDNPASGCGYERDRKTPTHLADLRGPRHAPRHL